MRPVSGTPGEPYGLSMERIDIRTIGRPNGEHHLRPFRGAAAVVAAFAGGVAAVLVALALMGTVGPSDSPGLWAGVAAAALVWLTGLWWRWDAPDARMHTNERERRGF